MSHVAKIELEIQSLEDLKLACRRLGFIFQENQQNYQWYGRSVGDYPLPEGITVDALGKCDHAIKVPECTYEIGVVKRGTKYILLWDSWHAGGLEQKIGSDAGISSKHTPLSVSKGKPNSKSTRSEKSRKTSPCDWF